MPSEQSEALKTFYETVGSTLSSVPDVPLALNRALLDCVHSVASEPEDVSYREVKAAGRDAIWCIPPDADRDRCILYLHGGGFVVQSVHSHRKLAGHLASAANCRTLILDYRRAPEHTYPAQIEDAENAYLWLLGQGVQPSHIAFAGDSAGVCLAVSTAVRLRDKSNELPAAVVGFSPWFDLECSSTDLDVAPRDALVQRQLVEEMALTYLGGHVAATDPSANPLHADLTGLPPVYLTAGGDEALLDNGVRFADRARAAGVDVVLEVEPGQQHVYQFMAGRAPEADRSITSAGSWISQRLALSVSVQT